MSKHSLDRDTQPLTTILRPHADRPGYAAFYAEDDLYHSDREAWQRRYGQYHQRSSAIYLLPIPLGVIAGIVTFALCLLHGNPTVGAISLIVLFPVFGVLSAVGWWLSDRHQVDPTGTGRRVRGIAWAITAIWGAKKIIG